MEGVAIRPDYSNMYAWPSEEERALYIPREVSLNA